MARKVATILLVFGYCSCMEMRETVERTVMVRTTGSDLQPAATGYIYKKKSDGPVSVVKMGESEVMEHFSKLYNTPKAYKESTAEAPPVYSKEKEELKVAPASLSHADLENSQSSDSASQASAADSSDEHVKPIVEVNQEEDKIDGIANEEFDKLFEDYVRNLDQKNRFIDYLHGLGHYDRGIYQHHTHGDEKDYGLKRYGYGGEGQEDDGKYNEYEKGESKDDYLIENQGRYFILKKNGNQNNGFSEFHEPGRHHIHGLYDKDYDYDNEGSKKGKAIGGFHEGLRLDKFKKDNDFYDRQAFEGGNHGYSGRYGSGAKEYKGRNSHDAGHRDGYFGESDDVEKESGDDHNDRHSSGERDGAGHRLHRNFRVKGQHDTGESYRYDVKH